MNLKDPLNTYKEIDENDVFIASSLRTTDKQVGSVNKLKTFDVKESEPSKRILFYLNLIIFNSENCITSIISK